MSHLCRASTDLNVKNSIHDDMVIVFREQGKADGKMVVLGQLTMLHGI